MSPRLRLDPTACTGHRLCADLLPELIDIDEWGYPIVLTEDVPAHLMPLARRAVAICPNLALRLARATPAARGQS